MKVYTYIDGESHYIRLEKAWAKLHGDDACLSQLRFSDDLNGELLLLLPHAKVFWTKRWSPGQTVFYYTAVSGNESLIHDVRKRIRDFDLEPEVIKEEKMLADKRRTRLEQGALIEKPKGVDCAIFVRMLMDAHSGLYELCNLYTSEVDYVPVIRAVQNLGKRVVVHGFKDGLGEYSELEHVAKFVDLEETLKSDCQCVAKGMADGG